MAIANQSIPELLILGLTGLVCLGFGLVAATDYRGYTGHLAERVWSDRRKRPIQWMSFVWSAKQRERFTDPSQLTSIRRGLRIPAAVMTLFGFLIIVFEVVVMISGHVV